MHDCPCQLHSARVVVTPIYLWREPRTGRPITLARVPALHELVRIPEGQAHAGDYKVVGVTHHARAVVPDGATGGEGIDGVAAAAPVAGAAAELFLQPTPTMADAKRAMQEAERAAKAGK
jgi:hypothetical protein